MREWYVLAFGVVRSREVRKKVIGFQHLVSRIGSPQDEVNVLRKDLRLTCASLYY